MYLFIYLTYITIHQSYVESATAACNPLPPYRKYVSTTNFYYIGLFSIGLNNGTVDYQALRFHFAMKDTLMAWDPYNYIGFISYDVCDSPERLTQIVTSVMLSKRYKTRQKKFQTEGSGYRCECSKYFSTDIIAVLSYLSDDLTRLLANLLLPENLLLFSHTSTDIFPNHPDNYPHFYPDYKVNSAFLYELRQSISDLNFNNIALIQIGSNEFTSSQHKIFWDYFSANNKTCITTVSIESNYQQMNSTVQILKHIRNFTIFMIWTNQEDDFQQFKTLAEQMSLKIQQWILFITLSVFLEVSKNKNVYTLVNFISAVSKPGSFEELLEDQWFNILNKNVKNKTFYNKIYPGKTDPASGYFIHALMETSFLHSDRERKEHIKSYFNKNAKLFKKQGGRKYGFTELPNKDRLKCTPVICPAGLSSEFKTVDLDKFIQSRGWHCIPCKENYFKKTVGYHPCIKCPYEWISNENRTTCSFPYSYIYLRPFDHVGRVVLSVSCIGVLIVIITIFILIKFRKTPLVKATDFRASITQLIIHNILLVLVPVLYLGKPTKLICTYRPITFSLLYMLIISITLTKSEKLLTIFQVPFQMNRSEIIKIKVKEVFIPIFVSIIQIFLFVISTSKLSPKLNVITIKETFVTNITCNSDIHLQLQLAFIFGLSFVCGVQAFRARKLPETFKETKYITFAMFTTDVLISTMFPLYYSQTNEYWRTVISLIILLVLNLVHFIIMFAYKVWILFFHPEQNTRQSFREIMMRKKEKSVWRKVNTSEN